MGCWRLLKIRCAINLQNTHQAFCILKSFLTKHFHHGINPANKRVLKNDDEDE